MIAIVAAFLFFSLVERFFLTHHHHEGEEHGHIMGPIGAVGLVAHSFLDGAAIGIAFQANAKVGIIVALAVISHDFTDGINTVVVMLKNEQNVKNARIFLFVDAIAPVFGIIVASFFTISQNGPRRNPGCFCRAVPLSWRRQFAAGNLPPCALENGAGDDFWCFTDIRADCD